MRRPVPVKALCICRHCLSMDQPQAMGVIIVNGSTVFLRKRQQEFSAGISCKESQLVSRADRHFRPAARFHHHRVQQCHARPANGGNAISCTLPRKFSAMGVEIATRPSRNRNGRGASRISKCSGPISNQTGRSEIFLKTAKSPFSSYPRTSWVLGKKPLVKSA